LKDEQFAKREKKKKNDVCAPRRVSLNQKKKYNQAVETFTRGGKVILEGERTV